MDNESRNNIIILLVLFILILLTYLIYDKVIAKPKTNVNNEVVSTQQSDDVTKSNTSNYSKGTQLLNYNLGDTVNVFSKDWVVISKLNNEVGLILKESETPRMFCGDLETRFSLEDHQSLLYYLNNYYIKSLDKDVILTKTWYTGEYKNETSSIIEAKVGLLTKSEYIELELEGYTKNFEETSGGAWWLLTPEESDFQNIVTADQRIWGGWINNTYNVKPVIYLLGEYVVK